MGEFDARDRVWDSFAWIIRFRLQEFFLVLFGGGVGSVSGLVVSKGLGSFQGP